MDTSKEYIQMCEKAEEIQTARSNRPLFEVKPELFTWKGGRLGWRVENEEQYEWPEGSWFVRDGDVIVSGDNSYGEYDLPSAIKEDIWLPRQDQLQEMVDKPYKAKHVDLQNKIRHEQLALFARQFGRFITEEKLLDMTSMEQLWLAFVMKENYGKVWNGEEWKVVI